MKTEGETAAPNAKMEQIFVARTLLHQKLVQKNLLQMQGYLDLSRDELLETGNKHDISKFNEPERTAYIWMSWLYHCRNNRIPFNYSDKVAAIVQQGWNHHVINNRHHPEGHTHPDEMGVLDLVEMVCDWTAIHQEQNLNDGSCLQWAEFNLDLKWNFSREKKNFIFATIAELDARNRLLICD